MFVEFHLGDWGSSGGWVIIHHYPGYQFLRSRQESTGEEGRRRRRRRKEREKRDIPIHRPLWFSLSEKLGPIIVGLSWR